MAARTPPGVPPPTAQAKNQREAARDRMRERRAKARAEKAAAATDAAAGKKPVDRSTERIRQLWHVDNGVIRATMHEFQSRAWKSIKRFVFMIAGTQGGKTSFGPLWLYREMQRCGPGDYLAVTSTFPLLKKKMLPEFLRLFDHTLHLGEWMASDKMYVISPEKAKELWPHLPDAAEIPTRIMFGSASNANSLESATAKAAWLDEVGQDDFTLEAFEAVLRRLALFRGRILAGTTLYNLGWLKQQVYDPGRAGDPDIEIIQFASTANPAFPVEEFERARRTMDAWKFKMFFLGEYDRPPGMIYHDFQHQPRDLGGHIVDPFQPPATWERFVGVDPGGVNHAKVYFAKDPATGIFYLYKETKWSGRPTGEHAKEIIEEVAGSVLRHCMVGAKPEGQTRLDYQAHGIYAEEPEVADVEAGIDRVIAALKERQFFVCANCTGTLDQFTTYSRELNDMGEVTEKIKNKDRYHFLDAVRYIAQRFPDAGSVIGTSGDRQSSTRLRETARVGAARNLYAGMRIGGE